MPTHVQSPFLADLMGDSGFDRLDPRSFRPPDGPNAAAQNGQADTLGMGPRERRRQLLAERRNMLVDTGEMEAPQFDAEQSRLNKIVTGVGAATSLIAALGGSEIGAAAGAGLAQGGARNLRRQRKSFRRRQQAFRERTQRAQQFNRDVALSTNEAQVRGAEQQIERQAEQQEQQQQFRREEELLRLRERLENKLSPSERQKVQKELDLLDERIQSRRALTTERQTQAEANRALAERRRRPDGDEEGEQTAFSHLSDDQITALLKRSRGILEKGFPPSVDTDESGDLSTAEMLSAQEAGVSLPSSADIDRVAERMSALREEASRRGLIDSEEQAAPGQRAESRTAPSAGGNGQVSDQEIQRALQMVQEGTITAEQFEQTYGMSVSEARQQ